MTLDLNKCEPQTLYTDAQGKLWRVVGYWTEPVVTMEAVEADGNTGAPLRITGGIRGYMWEGFKRLVPEGKPVPPQEPVYSGAICRGAVSLGTACGSCERCLWRKKMGLDH